MLSPVPFYHRLLVPFVAFAFNDIGTVVGCFGPCAPVSLQLAPFADVPCTPRVYRGLRGVSLSWLHYGRLVLGLISGLYGRPVLDFWPSF